MNNEPLYVIYESHTRTFRELQRSIVHRWYNTQYLATSFWFIFFCNSFFSINLRGFFGVFITELPGTCNMKMSSIRTKGCVFELNTYYQVFSI